jgi:CIC family chloride channel protein
MTERAAALYRRAYEAWLAAKQRFAPTERQRLFGLTIAIGGACGLAAVGFHLAIDFVAEHTIGPALAAPDYEWVWLVVLVPTLGAIVAGVALAYAFPQARGSGIPQVKAAYGTKHGRVRVRDAAAKFGIGALQIGSGSSLGREGPTVQICAGVATGLGRLAGVAPPNVRRMMPVGAAAGIAAAFNAPIAAVTFAIEEIVGTLDQTLLSGVIVAAALAAVVERSVLGIEPVFTVAVAHGLDAPSSLLLYALLGVAAGLVALAFTWSLLELRRRFKASTKLPRWAHPAIGAFVTGGLAVVALAAFRAPGITGGGYGLLDAALDGRLAVKVLLGLCALKLVATVWSYGSGGAGGIFAPSLCIGGLLGGSIGYLDVELFGHPHAVVGSFALVGMGAVFAGAVRAPITSVLIIIEMTNGYSLILPLMIANMSAYALARAIQPTAIYEALLEQDGIHLARPTIDAAAIDQLAMSEFPELDRSFVRFHHALRGAALVTGSAAAGRQEVFPVVDAGDRLVGIVTIEELALLAAEPQLQGGLVTAGDLMRPPLSVGEDDTVAAAFELLRASGVRELPVIDGDRHVVGLVDEVAIAHAYLDARRTKRTGTTEPRRSP